MTDASPPPRRRLRPEERKAEIVRDTYLLFRSTDPQHLALSGVAKRLGVSRGLIYKYFGTFEELVAAVYADQEEALHDKLVLDAVTADNMHDAVRRIVEAYVDYVIDHADAYQTLVGTGLTRANRELRAQRARQDDTMAQYLGGGPYAHLAAEAISPLLQQGMVGWLGRRDLTVPELKTALEHLLWGLLTSFEPLGWMPRIVSQQP